MGNPSVRAPGASDREGRARSFAFSSARRARSRDLVPTTRWARAEGPRAGTETAEAPGEDIRFVATRRMVSHMDEEPPQPPPAPWATPPLEPGVPPRRSGRRRVVAA